MLIIRLARLVLAAVLLLAPGLVQADTHILYDPPSEEAVVFVPLAPLVLPAVITPTFPDRTLQYQQAVAYDAAQAHCQAAGGAFDGACHLPPPPPLPPPATPPRPVIYYGNGYDWGNCTWFVANQRGVPGNWGNANQWYYAASSSGWAVGYVPRLGSIAWTPAGAYGHVALVVAINGGEVEVSEMNVYGVGEQDYRWTRTSEWGGFIY